MDRLRPRIADRKVTRLVLQFLKTGVLVSGTQEAALVEKAAIADNLRKTTGLELAPDKTKITALTDGFEFLGHRGRYKWDQRFGYSPRVEIPKAKAHHHLEAVHDDESR